tara:strand:- start:214 stop:597 length:384 start_codon:yes stop_codon:yes gene_type:complete
VINHIQPKSFPESAAPFSQAVLDDTYAHLAGVVAADFPEGQAVLGDAYEETKAVMTAMATMLEELGLSLERVVKTDVHLADLVHFDEMDRAYREFFELGKFPARTTTESPKLFGGSLVEVTMMARLE